MICSYKTRMFDPAKVIRTKNRPDRSIAGTLRSIQTYMRDVANFNLNGERY